MFSNTDVLQRALVKSLTEHIMVEPTPLGTSRQEHHDSLPAGLLLPARGNQREEFQSWAALEPFPSLIFTFSKNVPILAPDAAKETNGNKSPFGMNPFRFMAPPVQDTFPTCRVKPDFALCSEPLF